jgi:hypothetical protein
MEELPEDCRVTGPLSKLDLFPEFEGSSKEGQNIGDYDPAKYCLKVHAMLNVREELEIIEVGCGGSAAEMELIIV